MNTQNIYECERRNLEKIKRYFSLPNYLKAPSIASAAILLLLLLVLGTFSETDPLVKVTIEKLTLVALLIAALSKEKIEDELISKIRGQAYTVAFVSGVVYALVQPYINYIVLRFLKPDKANYSELSVFIILWFMLVIYLCTFYLLKRTS